VHVLGERVLVEHLGQWVPATVLWEYVDTGRPRSLVRYETPLGSVVRRLCWHDELRPVGTVVELRLLEATVDSDQ
jgi:hypothetical protein